MRNRPSLAILTFLTVSLSAGAAHAVSRSFSAQSLIIPMDMCYQTSSLDTAWEDYIRNDSWGPDTPPVQPAPYPSYCNLPGSPKKPDDGILKAYGLIYRLLQNGIKVYVILDQTKTTIDGIDMTVSTNADQQTPVSLLNRATGGTTEFYGKATGGSTSKISYRGSPFIIDASQHDQALALIMATTSTTSIPPLSPMFDSVDIHVANTLFTAPVRSVLLQTPPQIALFNLGGAAGTILTGYLNDAGLNTPDAVGVFPANGSVYTEFNKPNDFISGGLKTGNAGQPFKILWAPHFAFSSTSMSPNPLSDATNVMSAVTAFVDAGGALFSECAAMLNYEGGSGFTQYGTRFMTTGGLDANGNMLYPYWWNNFDRFPSFSQPQQKWKWSDPTNYLLQIGDFKLRRGHGTSANFQPSNGSSYFSYVQRLVVSSDTGNSDNDNWDLLTYVPNKDNNPKRGPIIYFGGHAYGSQESSCGTSCSGLLTVTPNIAGTRIVLNTLLFFGQEVTTLELTRSSPILYSDGKTYQGSYVETNPVNAAYPPVAGHFREYPPGALSGQTTAAFGKPVADWDAASLIPAPANRKVYTVVPGNGWTQLTAANANLLAPSMGLSVAPTNTATPAINGILAGTLGGVDHSIPAVIPASTIAGAATRPTVAYFGALDGMLHAVLVSGSAASSSVAGTELWAFIPPSQIGKIATYTASVDGSPQVADAFVKDATGHYNWRTLLAVTCGATGGGTIDVLDITDPNTPRWMWTGNNVNGTFAMGSARGAAWGRIDTGNNGAGEYVVFLSTNNAGTAGTGINVYALDASTGAVVWQFNRKYTHHIPGTGSPGTPVQNDVPSPPAVANLKGDTGIADSVFAGDIDGNVWLIPAGKGFTGAPAALYTATGDGQPLENGIALYRNNGTNGQPRNINVIGVAGGADWLPLTVQSQIFTVDAQKGLPGPITYSALLPVGEHVYATPTVAGNDVYIITSTGYFKGDIGSSYQEVGYLRRFNLSGTGGTQLAQIGKGSSEVAVSADGSAVVATSAGGITQSANGGHDAAGLVLNNATPKPMAVRAWLNLQ